LVEGDYTGKRALRQDVVRVAVRFQFEMLQPDGKIIIDRGLSSWQDSILLAGSLPIVTPNTESTTNISIIAPLSSLENRAQWYKQTKISEFWLTTDKIEDFLRLSGQPATIVINLCTSLFSAPLEEVLRSDCDQTICAETSDIWQKRRQKLGFLQTESVRESWIVPESLSLKKRIKKIRDVCISSKLAGLSLTHPLPLGYATKPSEREYLPRNGDLGYTVSNRRLFRKLFGVDPTDIRPSRINTSLSFWGTDDQRFEQEWDRFREEIAKKAQSQVVAELKGPTIWLQSQNLWVAQQEKTVRRRSTVILMGDLAQDRSRLALEHQLVAGSQGRIEGIVIDARSVPVRRIDNYLTRLLAK
jgi:hypothetical protein